MPRPGKKPKKTPEPEKRAASKPMLYRDGPTKLHPGLSQRAIWKHDRYGFRWGLPYLLTEEDDFFYPRVLKDVLPLPLSSLVSRIVELAARRATRLREFESFGYSPTPRRATYDYNCPPSGIGFAKARGPKVLRCHRMIFCPLCAISEVYELYHRWLHCAATITSFEQRSLQLYTWKTHLWDLTAEEAIGQFYHHCANRPFRLKEIHPWCLGATHWQSLYPDPDAPAIPGGHHKTLTTDWIGERRLLVDLGVDDDVESGPLHFRYGAPTDPDRYQTILTGPAHAETRKIAIQKMVAKLCRYPGSLLDADHWRAVAALYIAAYSPGR